MTDGAHRRRVFAMVAALLGCLLALHVGQWLAGHRTYAMFAPVVLAVVLGAGTLLTPVPRDWIDRVAASGTLVVVLALPEWLEGEWRAGHGLTRATVHDHAWTMVAVVMIAVGLGALWRMRETLRAVTDR